MGVRYVSVQYAIYLHTVVCVLSYTDVCVPNLCENGGKCTEHNDPVDGRMPSCSCVDGWHGDKCDESKNIIVTA